MTDLIVNDVRPRVQFEQTAAGAVTFDLPFPALAAAHLKVSIDGGPVNAAPYSVENLGQTGGARIVFAAAPPLGAKIAVWRAAPVERLTDFADDGSFRAKALNQELDRIALLLQELEAGAGDALRKPPSDADVELTLPSAASRANRVLSFDADGRPQTLHAAEDAAVAADLAAEIVTLAAVAPSISALGGVAGSVATVGGIADAVSQLAAIRDEVSLLAGVGAAPLTQVAGDSADIQALADSLAAVNLVASNINNGVIDAVHDYGSVADAVVSSNDWGSV